jgi:hypothetical protein
MKKPTNSISKKLFIETINTIQKQIEYDRKCGEAFEVILPNDFITGYDNNLLISQLIKILEIATNDSERDGWIGYFIWELEFGKQYKDGCVTFEEKNIKLKTPSDLWDLLTKK